MEPFEISKFNPCHGALIFRSKFNSFEEAWEECPRGDWMLWIAQCLRVNKRLLTLAKALCAETVLHLMKDERSINAVKVAKNYGKHLATDEELAEAAYAAAYAAAEAKAAYAATDADSAVYAAYAATDADYADSAVYAAYAAEAADYADSDAKKDNQLLTANICREVLTKEVFNKIKNDRITRID